MKARNPIVIAEYIKSALTHASHDPHVDSHISRVSQLHADMCNG